MQQIVQESGESGYPAGYAFNLSDFALFLSVMKNKRAYEDVLSIILDEPDIKLREVHIEQVVLNQFGKRAIRLDALGYTEDERQINMEMENNAAKDDVRKRSRFYQSMLDTPILKSGKKTKYRQLPPTVIIFITQEDIFKQDRAKYTFTEQCEEVPGLHLGDGTQKIFLNMTSKNASQVLVSLLQYMKDTRIDNPEISVKDERIVDLDRIVTEVKESEEWEAVKMNILEVGLMRGEERGRKLGREEALTDQVCKKLQKGMETSEIAELLEVSEEEVQKIVDVAGEFAPEYSVEKVWSAFQKKWFQ